jgi:asparagine synthase (glutamine-hydrolysing)
VGADRRDYFGHLSVRDVGPSIVSRIAGLVTNRPPEQALGDLAVMVGSLLHEPFYEYRTLSIPSAGCYVAWVQHGPDASDGHVAINEREDLIVVFAGEHFAERSDWNARALLDRYEQDGVRCLRDLNGWFAGVLVDVRERRALLFNDRYGLHPLYYERESGTFSFGSEAKAVLARRSGATRFNVEAVGEWLGAGAVLGQRTLFEGVHRLPGASAWWISPADDVVEGRYFSPEEWESQPSLSDEAFSEELRSTFARVIPRYFRGHAAVSLTGGLDTRAIMAFAPTVPARRAYTYGGMFRDTYDVRISRTIAGACGYQHDVFRLDPQFLAEFPDLARQTVWTTDAMVDPGVSHEIYLSRQARGVAPIRITGNYGSEVLRSVSTFKPLDLPEALFDAGFLPHVREAQRTLAIHRAANAVTFAAFKEIPWSLYGRLAAAQTQLAVRSPFTDNAVVALAFRGPKERRQQQRLWLRLLADRNRALASIPTDTGHTGVGASFRTLPDRLHKYALFKAEWYYESGMPSWIARIDRRYGRGRRPPWFVGSHKMEQYRRWFGDQLLDWSESMLADVERVAPFFDRNALQRVAAAHAAGSGNFTSIIVRVATIALAHDLFIRRMARRPVSLKQSLDPVAASPREQLTGARIAPPAATA